MLIDVDRCWGKVSLKLKIAIYNDSERIQISKLVTQLPDYT
jgi:hypothetical protein